MGDGLELTTTDGATFRFQPTRLIVAGYTGRDRAAVQEHIAELATLGIAPPERVPTYFDLPPELARQDDVMTVAGARTSGEAEPVLLFTERGRFFAVGSDHTDRDLEREDITASKAACPKLISRHVLPYDDIETCWDACTLESWAGGRAYQRGPLAGITPAQETVRDLTEVLGKPEVGLVLFLGTIPLLDAAFAYTDAYRMSFSTPHGSSIACSYRVLRRT